MHVLTSWTSFETPLGPMILAASDAGLQGAWFERQRHFSGPEPSWAARNDHPVLKVARSELAAWFSGELRNFTLPLAPVGTPFQRSVWQAIAGIGFGQTRGYGVLAASLGRPAAARAVGAATGRNPLSIIIPCHRLVGSAGALTGYAGGLDRKHALLAFEAGQTSMLKAWA